MDFERFMQYLQLPQVRNALIVAVLIALCASLLGVTLVLKRFSYIGDGLSHVAFGAMTVAAVVGLTEDMLLVMPVTILSAILLLRTGQNTKVKGDAQIAMISVGSLAVGYLLLNKFPPKNSNISNDVCSTLFGNKILVSLSTFDVYVSIILSVVLVIVFILFYNKIFAVTFDESFTKATGNNTGIYNLVIAVIIAVVIVLAMNLVGSLLISALIIFPSLSAMRVFKNFKSVTICAAVVSVTCAFLGITLAIVFDGLIVGPTIVVVNLIVFFAFWLIGAIKGR